MNNIVTLSDIYKNFNTKHGRIDVLNGINLEIRSGDFAVILGKSGCGKSTLLNVMGFMDNFTSGRYLFGEQDASCFSSAEKAKIRNEKIGFVFQSYNLIHTMTALENVEIPMGYKGIGKGERRNRAMELLEKVGVSHRANHKPYDMSGGEQQRTAIARAIVNEPILILADEPTGNLDEKNADEIMGLLKQLNENGTTVVMVTHNSNMIKFASLDINISMGKIV